MRRELRRSDPSIAILDACRVRFTYDAAPIRIDEYVRMNHGHRHRRARHGPENGLICGLPLRQDLFVTL